jgi:hypothetical protein
MKFQSRWVKATYIVRPTTRIIYPGQGSELKPGLRAEFDGQQRIFDSSRAQERYGWTDEERERVENHLLKHKDWGRGLYLAPGEVLSDDKASIARPTKAVTKRCAFITTEGGDITQCKKEATLGKEFCQEHDTDRVVKKGMLTARDSG